MVKYKAGDKVVIRKDLIDGDYRLENTHWYITDEMIEGLYEPHNEITKKVLLRNGTTVECKAKDLLVVDDMKYVKDNIKKYPDSVVILSSEILVIK